MEQKVIMTDVRKKDYFYEEAIKTLRTNIQFTGKNIKTIMFTSCLPNEGKSDVAFQLAQEIGNMGKKVLLIDADIRRSVYVNRYKIKEKVKGLSQYKWTVSERILNLSNKFFKCGHNFFRSYSTKSIGTFGRSFFF